MTPAEKSRLALTQLVRSATDLATVFGVGIPDFGKAQQQLYTPFRTLVIDLGRTEGQSALGDVYKEISGDFIYVDPDQPTLNPSIGTVTIEANDLTAVDVAPFTANPGFALNAVFHGLKIRYTSQPGKRLVLKYSTGYSVIPSFAALSSISGIVSTQDYSDDYASKYSDTAAIASGGNAVVLLPAGNTAGLRIVRAFFGSYQGAGTGLSVALIAHTVAPAAWTDGDMVLQSVPLAIGGNFVQSGKLERPLRTVAGRGLYFFNGEGVVEAGARHSALYKAL